MSELKRYAVIDRLDVGPVKLTPFSLRTVYRVTVDGVLRETTFSYRFKEPVFKLEELASVNLAAMMSVMPALNYGLFCRRISFHDDFDETDQHFLCEMMENTSREIVVKKLHETNAFLLPGWQLSQIPKLDRYTQADLEFRHVAKDSNQDDWPVREEGYCVLSSGGKESLLSYGLLQELGCEPHPVYINESGRHWFTALNGYRHFEKFEPKTARVWTDSDRLFNWMLRRIRFIRSDFQRLRADDYPLRLWTVAVFLFGALPLLRKRGLKHLVVGNEFDTSRYIHEAELPYYDGLFDQSRWFDETLTTYFSQKGWFVRVSSILRNLSETLVEKILSGRYPDLFTSQVSCHAALYDKGRIKPCGRCEKCRRIIAILTAIGVDPSIIGYSEEMQKRALETLIQKGLHSQLAGEFEQVLTMLKRENKPQIIEHVRISSTQAPLSEIPSDIRSNLLTLLESYSQGILEDDEKGMWRKKTLSELSTLN